MKKYTDSDIEKARKLRLLHRYSFNQLQKITGIPATTLKRWSKDDPGLNTSAMLLLYHEKKRAALKQSELATIPKLIHPSYKKLILSFLYWCEGSKYPSSNVLTFVNSDPLLIKAFITLLRKSFVLDESKFSVRLQIHNTHDYGKIKSYWSKLLDIPFNRFIKPTITEKRYGKHRENYIGTCSLKYQDYRLQLKLIGIYEHIGNKLDKLL